MTPRRSSHPTCVCGHRQTAHGGSISVRNSVGVEVGRAGTSCTVDHCGCAVFRNVRQQPHRCGICGALGHSRRTCTSVEALRK
jgi:hypothetical protein